MKKILRSPHTWVGLSICVLAVFLYMKGYRITYNPMLENSWDAISAFASWCGAILSGGALIVAIQIPKEIANQQNKIELFEKRYSVWETLMFLKTIVKEICTDDVKVYDPKKRLDKWVANYTTNSSVGLVSDEYTDSVGVYRKLIFEVAKIGYLFPIDQNEVELVKAFLFAFRKYVCDVYIDKPADKMVLKETYTNLFDEEFENKMKQQLKI